MFVGDKLEIVARVFLGPVDPTHVRVQAYVGESDNGTLRNPYTVDLASVEKGGDNGVYRFSGMIPDLGKWKLRIQRPGDSDPSEPRSGSRIKIDHLGEMTGDRSSGVRSAE